MTVNLESELQNVNYALQKFFDVHTPSNALNTLLEQCGPKPLTLPPGFGTRVFYFFFPEQRDWILASNIQAENNPLAAHTTEILRVFNAFTVMTDRFPNYRGKKEYLTNIQKRCSALTSLTARVKAQAITALILKVALIAFLTFVAYDNPTKTTLYVCMTAIALIPVAQRLFKTWIQDPGLSDSAEKILKINL